jgi:hypothetical protein
MDRSDVPDRPRRRTRRVIVTEAGDDLVIYDRDSDTAHAITGVSARLWMLCDGTRDVPGLATECGTTQEHVEDCLAGLDEVDLLAAGFARRDLLRATAIGSALAGVGIISILAPTAAMAASGPGGGTVGGG